MEKYGRGLHPNSRNGFEKHGNRNPLKRKETILKRYGRFLGRPKGLKHTEETKKLIGEKVREHWKNHKNPRDKRIKHVCPHCKKIFVGHKKRKVCSIACKNAVQQKNGTYIERKIRTLLINNNIPFVEQFNLDNRFVFDFKLLYSNILIECDGEYWHSFNKRKELDKVKDEEANNFGYDVIRFAEKDIKNNIGICEKIILNKIGG